ncbi:MAG: hypothetical protein COA52_12635 [Hyphomicrobiales bacterium]|nr:MAG: hypothetical protein COA52_12635 [Hyphomicrobiales bacterium]
MALINVQLPFFKPLWRRIATVVICLGWGTFEFVDGSPFWGVLFVGLGLICAYEFFVAFNPDGDSKAQD